MEDNTSLKLRIANLLNCQVGTFPRTYLGIPLRPGKLANEDWQHLLVKVDCRLAGWKGNILSRGGRLVLIKWMR